MERLTLALFGPFVAEIAAHSLRLPTDKTRALLAYLALSPNAPLRRETLAGLLWPDQPEALARQNLRKTAGRLREAIHFLSPDLASRLLSLTKQTIELDAAFCTVDVLQFRAHLDTARRHAHASLSQCADCLTGLEAAVELCRRGPLLAGLSLPDAEPFEEWLRAEREHLHQQQLSTLHQLTVAYEQQGAYEMARTFAERQIEAEPWQEEAHRQLMRLLAAQGLRAEAIAQYQACRRILQDELGVEPAAETEALLTQIMHGSLPVAASRSEEARPQPWPRPAGPLIGREAELVNIINLLEAPGCRIVTITGLGGIGKTSLAAAVGQRLRQAPPAWLPDGIYFVSLAEVSSASLLPAALAEAVGLAVHQRQSTAIQVEQFLRHSAMLLILDNFENLAPEADWLRELAAKATHLKLLLTSREPLNWQDEWRYPLEGLAYPADEAGNGRYEAVDLFVQAARQVLPGFALTAENSAAIARICQLVHGWPLALQMTAAWVPMMNCHAIANQISASLDLFTTSLRDVPPRQRSIRAIFEHTWNSLTPDEQAGLARLAVFRGGFTLAAAMDAAATSPIVLRGLADKALVRHDEPSGRYTMHEVLSQFAQEKAETDPAAFALARQAHSRYYLGLLKREGERLHTTEYQAALDDLRAEMDNVHQAWLWSATRQEPAALAAGLGHLATYYESSGLPQEAATFLRRTLAVLDGSGAAPVSALTAQIYYQIAASLLTAGQYAEALTASHASLKIARELDDADLTNQIFINQSYIYREQGQYEETQAVLNEAIAYSRRRNDLLGVARALHAQGNTHWSMGEYEPARACYESGRELYGQLGDEISVAILTGNIGVVLWRQGHYFEALANYEVALAAVRRIGNATRVAVWLGNIGLVYVDLGDDERALAYLNEGLHMHDQLGRTYYRIELQLGKAAVLLRQGDLAGAAQLLKQATDLAYLIGNRTYLLDCDRLQARLFRAQGQAAQAAQLLQSLRKREFRPDAAAAIEHELAQLAEAA